MPTYLNVEQLSVDVKNAQPRFFYPNLCNAGNASMTNSWNGIATKAQAIKAGHGEFSSSPSTSSMTSDAHFIVEIDSIAVGNTVGTATFRWGREYFDYSGLTYLAYGITTGTGITLGGNLSVSFYEGITNPDFYVGDKWTFDVVGEFFLEKSFSKDRAHACKPLGNNTVISIDLSQEDDQEVGALIIYDHNMTENSEIVWAIGNELHTFTGSGNGKNVVYLDPFVSFPYHTITIDGSAEDRDVQFGKFYLGKYLTLERHREIGHTRSRVVQGNVDDLVFKFSNFDVERIEFSFPLLEDVVAGSDLRNLMSLLGESVRAGISHTPFFVHFNPSYDLDLNLFTLESVDRVRSNQYINLYNMAISIVEVPKPFYMIPELG